MRKTKPTSKRKPQPKPSRRTRAMIDTKGKRLQHFDPDALVLVTQKSHPLYDPRVNFPANEKLVNDLGINGIIEPVIVRKNGTAIEVVDGRQRVQAAREYNRRAKDAGTRPLQVPVLFRHGADADHFGVSVSANEHRVNDDVVTKAEKLGRLLAMGWPEDECATLYGVTGVTISNWKAVLDLAPEVREAIRTDAITMTEAIRSIGQLPRDKQAEALAVATRKRLPPMTVARQRGARQPKVRMGVPRPKLRAILDAVIADPHATLSDREIALLGWVDGRVTEVELLAEYPLMREVLALTKRKPRGANGVSSKTHARPMPAAEVRP